MVPSSPRSIWIRGGDGAPERARKHVRSQLDPDVGVLSQLDPDVGALRASDAVLIVSELVTNCVCHANVGIDQTIFLELTTLGDHLRIAVTDPGSEFEPRLLPADPLAPGGLGLRVVDHLSSAWGVRRDAAGATRVWCDLPLAGAPPA
jgi:anti-sigma regulatory factor (Ser/Thr protein kinase)